MSRNSTPQDPPALPPPPWSAQAGENYNNRAILAVALAALLLGGCGAAPEMILDCSPVGELVPVCGLDRPEDIELLPDGRTLVISLMGDLETGGPGGLALYDTLGDTITHLPPFTGNSAESWGAADCPGAPGAAFSPHGIDLSTRPGGEQQLLAVNHGGPERIEYFEISGGGTGYQLEWRGCVLAPPASLLNDVVALPGGGFLATHMFDTDSPQMGKLNLAFIRGLLGFDTGHVIHWDGARFDVVDGTQAPLPNGIQISPDGEHLYLNAYLADEVRKISYPEGNLEARAAVTGPDNIQWDMEGGLLVASQTRPFSEIPACLKREKGACGASFEIVALDPRTMRTETIFRHIGAPMGAATVAQQVGNFLYIGSFIGDRMLRVNMPGAARLTDRQMADGVP